ncbi:zinc-dependent alcohol dehydrogenase [Thermovenabulum gondwanense]|uniref:Sorbitol dehydrogenase n=1 Tax=Thermovenabulum gondwanense TaxID=520767 RepID=A0A162MXE1_9FIRM|nr:galactitol-1-phosphate 5-dehydrogenase [Thermovenabulum gondwanense]KYO68073.1 Sorbitol dehydrogenase [Thermovenabulum gondwanense]
MEKMKAVVFYGPRDMRFEEVERPVPKEGEVCIKVKYASICGSDIEEYKIGSDRALPPLIFGHEFSGEIVEVGQGVSKERIGQRVSVNPILYCGKCFYCKKGLINLCNNRRSVGRTLGVEKKRCDGGFAEYVCVPEFSVVPLKEGVTFEEGALLEPLAVCYCAAKAVSFEKGENVLVIGSGPIGLMIIQFLKIFGSGKIVATDIMDFRLDAAKACGAHEVVNVKSESIEKALEYTGGIGYDRVIVTAGAPGVINDSIKLVRNGGSIILVSLIREEVSINPVSIVGRQLTVYGSYMFTTEMQDVMDYLADKRLDVRNIITSTYNLSETPEVFKDLASGNSKDIKVLLKID